MAENHELMGGKLHVYKRENSSFWQASAYLKGKNRRISTKEESLSHAKEIAEDWYLEMRGKARGGELKSGPTFKKAAEQFLAEYETITDGQRSKGWVEAYEWRLRVHLLPFFGKLTLSEITAGKVQEYRIERRRISVEKRGKPPARTSMHHDTVTIRQVLKTALRHGWLNALPDLSQPYKTSGKITHRAWFSPEEYQQLYEATRHRAQKPLHNRHRWACEQLHDYVLFMGNTGLRPDEAARLEFRDVRIVRDVGSGETILEIEVRGKRGVGWCKSTTGAVLPFKRLCERLRPDVIPDAEQDEDSLAREPSGRVRLVRPGPTDRLFPMKQRGLLNTILDELKLKQDRDGNLRTAYSLRHTYICFRLMEGADIYQIAKNCRTSVEMIEKFYAAHIKTTLDATAINVRKGVIQRERRDREGGPNISVRRDRKPAGRREGAPLRARAMPVRETPKALSPLRSEGSGKRAKTR
jgi:integrase